MALMAPIEYEAASPVVRAVYDEIMATRTVDSVKNFWKALANDPANLKRVWGVSTVSSWYKSESGRVAQNWPFNLIEYWQLTREPNPADYVYS